MQVEVLPLKIRSSSQMRQILGISFKYFNIVLQKFSSLCSELIIDNYHSNPSRKRRIGGGRTSKLKNDSEKLAFCLYYLKNYPTFAVFANRCDMSSSTAHDNLTRYMPLLKIALQELGVEPIREFENDEELSAYLKKKDLERLS